MTKRRTTIDDIAAEAGVSNAAVSYALNGKPGVSAATRERILAIAAKYNWAPSQQARNLGRSSTDTIGLVFPTSPDDPRCTQASLAFLGGLEGALREDGKSVLIHWEPNLEAELAIYRGWKSSGAVDGVVLVDLRADDARLAYLDEIGLPAYLTGRPHEDYGFAYAFTDEAVLMTGLLSDLVGLGHRRVSYVTDQPATQAGQTRQTAFDEAVASLALTDSHVVTTGSTFMEVADAVGAIVGESNEPLCLLVDCDLLAGQTLRAVTSLGKRVPDEVAVVCLSDGVLCRFSTPSITALDSDLAELGRAVAHLIVDETISRRQALPQAMLQHRESTNPA